MSYTLWFDSETFSEVPITNGTYAYCENAEFMLLGYAKDDEPADVIDCTINPHWREEFTDILAGADEIWAHNSMFDRTMLSYQGFKTNITQWRDTMIQAYCHGLPGSLGKLSKVLGLGEEKAKSERGRELVLLFCKPRPKNHKLRRATRHTHPEEWAEFRDEYTRLDVEALREIHKRMPTVNYPNGPELGYWHLDQERNDYGFLVDVDLADGAIELAKREKERLDQETHRLTGGRVAASTQRDKMLAYILESLGYPLPDMTKDTLERRLNDDNVPSEVKELLRIRLQGASSSVSKYKSLRKAVNSDNIFRGGIQFAGAFRTGRDAGRTFQPQNLPSRGLLGKKEIGLATALIREGVTPPPEQYPDLMHTLSSSIRGLLIPRPDFKLVVCDYSNIEGRFAAWVCREEWKLDAFRAYDAGTGPDLYKLAYAKSFNCDPSEVNDGLQRDIGKVQELMLQYQGGVGAYLNGSETYGFDIEELTNQVYDTLPKHLIGEAADFHDWTIEQKRPTFGISKKAFITCDVLKRMWRNTNPQIVKMWKALEETGLTAIDSPGKIFRVGKYLRFLRNGKHLYLRLPSGRWMVYPGCMIKNNKITFMGDDPYTRQYKRLSTHGGKIFENVCQGGSRDVLKNGEKNAKLQGFRTVLPVHDELVTEAPDNKYFTPHMLTVAMCSKEEWMTDFPLTAKAWEGYRYGK